MNIVMPAHPSASKFKVLNILLILSVMVGAPSKLQAGYGVFTVETLQTATTDELKQTEATQIFIRNPQGEPVTTLNCAGNARITQAVGDDQGHTLLIGYFTGTLFQGSRMLRSNSQNLFSMVINRQGEPLSFTALVAPMRVGVKVLPLKRTVLQYRFSFPIRRMVKSRYVFSSMNGANP